MSENTATLEEAVSFFTAKLNGIEGLPEGWTVVVEGAHCHNNCGGEKVTALFSDAVQDRSLKVFCTHSDKDDGRFGELQQDWEDFEAEVLPTIVENIDTIDAGDHVDTTQRATVHLVIVTTDDALGKLIDDFLADMEEEQGGE